MFLDARSLPEGEALSADICIVGAGAAGITLACELAGADFRVLLIESGGFDYAADTQDLYAGEVVGAEYFPLDAERLRYFGGSTNHWDGFCRPLDPLDFEERSHIAQSGWPFSRSDLDPYYVRAQTVLQLGPFKYDAVDWTMPSTPPLPLAGGRIGSGIFQCSPPTRFGKEYRDAIRGAPNVTALIEANLVEIETSETAAQATGLRLRCLDGKRLHATAKHYVLAAGGIENPRLLLNSNRIATQGLGNRHDLVGRYFMDHPVIWKAANIIFSQDSPAFEFYNYHVISGTKVQGCLVPSRETQIQERLPNFAIFLYPGSLVDVSPAAASARSIFESLRRSHLPDDLTFHLKRIIGDFDGLAAAAFRRAFSRQPPYFSTRFTCECPPDPNSRVMLGDATDALGLRRVKLDWRRPANYEQVFHRAYELLASALGQAGLGRVRINTAETTQDPMKAVENSHHHLGTTRMHLDPKLGVVDENCRVHGMGNLFVAGSSVFPTYGHANPTLTICALAIRLADHLKLVMQEG